MDNWMIATIFILMVVVFLGLTSAMVEVYRIEMDSYNIRMEAFYHEVFTYMKETNDTVNITGGIGL